MSSPKVGIKLKDKTTGQGRGKPLHERTRLHTKDIVYWLRRRHQQTNSNMNYLYFPEELQKHREVEKIFQRFDEDKSGKLGLGEFYQLLREANIQIDLKDLKEFYEKVDDDQDVALDFREFKNCTLSEEANLYFGRMMNKVRATSSGGNNESPKNNEEDEIDFSGLNTEDQDGEDSKKVRRNQYIPRTFGNLLNYITYGNKKKEITDVLKNNQLSYSQRFENFQELYDLKIGKDIYFAKYNDKFRAPGERRTTKLETSVTGIKSVSDSIQTHGFPQHFSSPDKPEKIEEGFIKEVNYISRMAREGAMKEFQEGQQKKYNFARGITAETPKTILSSSKGFQRINMRKRQDLTIQETDIAAPPDFFSLSPQSLTPQAAGFSKPSRLSNVDYHKPAFEDIMKTHESPNMRRTISNFRKTFGDKEDKSNPLSYQYSQGFIIKETQNEDDGGKLSPFETKLKKFVNTGYKDHNQRKYELKKEGSYSRNLLKTNENSSHYKIPLEGIEMLPGQPDSSDSERAPPNWNEALQRKQNNLEASYDVRSSKLPLAYSNVSTTFAYYQSKTAKKVSSTKNTPSLSIENLFGSPRSPKPNGSGSVRTNPANSPKMSSTRNSFKISATPSSRLQSKTATDQQKNEKMHVIKPITVTGFTMPQVAKSKNASRAQTQAQNRVKTDRDLLTED